MSVPNSEMPPCNGVRPPSCHIAEELPNQVGLSLPSRGVPRPSSTAFRSLHPPFPFVTPCTPFSTLIDLLYILDFLTESLLQQHTRIGTPQHYKDQLSRRRTRRGVHPPSMSLSSAFPFYFDKRDPSLLFPSPPASPKSDPFDFDIDSFTLCSPDGGFEDINALSPITTSTPSSTTLVSPKSSIADVSSLFPVTAVNDADAAEALSNHHLERYLHYKAIAAKAEADAQAQQSETINALLASCTTPETAPPMYNGVLSYQSVTPQYFGQTWSASYLPLDQSAAMAHAQAQAHMQAHDAAMAHAQQQRWVNHCTIDQDASFDAEVDPLWSRRSVSSTMSTPFPSTPASNNVSPIMAAPMMTSTASLPLVEEICTQDDFAEGEEEVEEDEQSSLVTEDIKPFISGTPLPNLHGRGRGYVPGETPDDPKKRHKCNVCGRGFARAFNLKVSVRLSYRSNLLTSLSPTRRLTIRRVRNRTCVHTPLVNAASRVSTTSNGIARASTPTAHSSMRSASVFPPLSLELSTGSRGALRREVSSSRPLERAAPNNAGLLFALHRPPP